MRRPFQLVVAVALFVATLLSGGVARAHAFTPFVLELRERTDGAFDVELRRPPGQATPTIDLPADCTLLDDTAENVRHRCPHLRGARIAARELDVAEVLVRVHLRDGTTSAATLHHDGEVFVVPDAPAGASLRAFVALGIRHIFGGVDHLAFLAALTLLVRARSRRRWFGPLVAALTSFTIAHSVTLGLAAFDVVRIAPTLAEPLIALSVAFLAAELVRPRARARSVLARRPALAAFAFGLLHGTGFASALADAGVARAELPRALLGFNVGVELGQLAFVAAFLLVAALVRRLPLASLVARPRLLGYATGAFAAAWTIERLGEVLR